MAWKLYATCNIFANGRQPQCDDTGEMLAVVDQVIASSQQPCDATPQHRNHD